MEPASAHKLRASETGRERNQNVDYMGYGRPVVALRGGDMVVTNFPIPKPEWTARLEMTGPLVGEPRSVRLFGDLLSRLVSKRAAGQDKSEGDYDILLTSLHELPAKPAGQHLTRC
jgi:hypothetical protein